MALSNFKVSEGQCKDMLREFAGEFQPLESQEQLILLKDAKTGAQYCECHLKASKIVSLVPLMYRSIMRDSQNTERTVKSS